MDSTLDVLTLRTVVAALPMATLVVDSYDEVVAVNRQALADFAISVHPGVIARFGELAMSYRIPGLRAGLEAMKTASGPAWLPDLSVATESGTQSMRILLSPLGLADGGRAVLVHAESRDEIVRVRQEHVLALEQLRNEAQSSRERLKTDNDALRADNDRLQDNYEDLQVRREELLTRCENLQADNDGLRARVAELAAARP